MNKKMIIATVLFFIFLHGVLSQKECTDLHGRLISHGLHYVPGPDTCTLCICDNGQSKVCKAVLCSPPQDCRSFRVGNTCCEFICLDDVVKPDEGGDAGVRAAAGGAAALALAAAVAAVYRARRRKRARQPRGDDQRSMNSIGYISGGYLCGEAAAGWKPAGLPPRGEAPPPYDEAVRARAEPLRMTSDGGYMRYSGDECGALVYGNIGHPGNPGHVGNLGQIANAPRQVQQIANPQACYNAPLLQTISSDPRDITLRPFANGEYSVGFPCVRLTGSLGAISGRNLQTRAEWTTHAAPPTLHRTIPRITGLESGFRRSAIPARRSFHKPGPPAPVEFDSHAHDTDNIPTIRVGRSRAHSDDQPYSPRTRETAPPPPEPPRPATPPPSAAPPDAPPAAPPTLPLTVDKPSCECYAGAGEEDDYRSECGNCTTRWVLEEGWSEPAGTQTLERRAPPPAAPPPAAAATLPPRVAPAKRNVGPPSNWENWFNTIPDSDTESEE